MTSKMKKSSPQTPESFEEFDRPLTTEAIRLHTTAKLFYDLADRTHGNERRDLMRKAADATQAMREENERFRLSSLKVISTQKT